jgi:acyl carrier protein
VPHKRRNDMKRDDFALANMQSAPHAGISFDRAELWLRDFLQREFAIAADRLVLSADIYQDLDLDSIDAAEIVMKFNDAFDRNVDAREFRRVRTLAQAIDLLLR